MNPSRRKQVLVFLVVAILAAVTVGFALAFVVDPPEGDDVPDGDGEPAGAVEEQAVVGDARTVVYSPNGQRNLDAEEIAAARDEGAPVKWRPGSYSIEVKLPDGETLQWPPVSKLASSMSIPIIVSGANCFGFIPGSDEGSRGAIEVVETGDRITITVIAPPEANSEVADCITPTADVRLADPIGDRVVEVGYGTEGESVEARFAEPVGGREPGPGGIMDGPGRRNERTEMVANMFAWHAAEYPIFTCQHLADESFLDELSGNREQALNMCHDLIESDFGYARRGGVRSERTAQVIGTNEVGITVSNRKTNEPLRAYKLEWRENAWFFTAKHLVTAQP